MIERIRIQNFKSILDLAFEPGNFNVFIGENGCGKTNILEAIAMGAASMEIELKREYLMYRGIRLLEPRLMRSRLNPENDERDIPIEIEFDIKDLGPIKAELSYVNKVNGGAVWQNLWFQNIWNQAWQEISEGKASTQTKNAFKAGVIFNTALAIYFNVQEKFSSNTQYTETIESEFVLLNDYIIYYPEYSILKNPTLVPISEPLGYRGEGLYDVLWKIDQDKAQKTEFLEYLNFFDWVGHSPVLEKISHQENTSLKIRDRYLSSPDELLPDQGLNEGFFFLAFYYCLFATEYTPKFFAVENIDNSLNPKLCRNLIHKMAELAIKNEKQALVTTHNPAVLDGLDITDDRQRLFVVNRDMEGETSIERVMPTDHFSRDIPLSQLWMQGFLGGLPDNF